MLLQMSSSLLFMISVPHSPVFIQYNTGPPNPLTHPHPKTLTYSTSMTSDITYQKPAVLMSVFMCVCLQCVSDSLKWVSYSLWDTGIFVALYVKGWMLLDLAHVCLFVCTCICFGVSLLRAQSFTQWMWLTFRHIFSYLTLTSVNMQ